MSERSIGFEVTRVESYTVPFNSRRVRIPLGDLNEDNQRRIYVRAEQMQDEMAARLEDEINRLAAEQGKLEGTWDEGFEFLVEAKKGSLC